MKNFHEEVATVKQLHVRISAEQAEGIRRIMMAFEDKHSVSATKQDIVSLILSRGIKALNEEYNINDGPGVFLYKTPRKIEVVPFDTLPPVKDEK